MDPLVKYLYGECKNQYSVIRRMDTRYMQAQNLLCTEYCPCSEEQFLKSPFHKKYALLNPGVKFAMKVQDCHQYNMLKDSRTFQQFEYLAKLLESEYSCGGMCSVTNQFVFTEKDGKPEMSCIAALTQKYLQTESNIDLTFQTVTILSGAALAIELFLCISSSTLDALSISDQLTVFDDNFQKVKSEYINHNQFTDENGD